MNSTQDAVFAGSICKIWKSWRRQTRALEGLTLRVPRGASFALLGPNGAGKTTFVKVLIGAVRPTTGVATVFGHPAGSKAARALLGYVPESGFAPLHLTGAQLIDHQSALHGMPRACRLRRTEELLEQVGMTQWATVPLKHYSRGMRQRVCIAAALAHKPEMLIFDEPTDGLDPASRREVLDVLRRLNREHGVTLLVNSHVLGEVEELCTEVAILSRGRLVRTGSLKELTAAAGYTVTVSEACPELECAFAARGIAAVRESGGLLRLSVASRDQLDWALDYARASAARIETLVRSANSLEMVYLTETQNCEEVAG